MSHCAAFIPLLRPTLPPALKWFFIIVAKTSLLSDPGARGDAKPPSPICKRAGSPVRAGGREDLTSPAAARCTWAVLCVNLLMCTSCLALLRFALSCFPWGFSPCFVGNLLPVHLYFQVLGGEWRQGGLITWFGCFKRTRRDGRKCAALGKEA